jgi:hypothetical protein
LSDNLEDAEEDIAKYDSDGVITFRHTSHKSKYQSLYEDFQVLHSFSGKVGDIVEGTIDQPFYEDMDAFVAAMQEASISNYTTKNHIGATETQYVYGGYGPAQALTVPKTEVSLDDIFSGDNFYGKQMQLEYEAWKELNPDQDFTQKEYQMAAVNTRAFEYESIRNQQESKEFWVQLGALVVIVGTTLICPPAGIALGVAYGAMELGSAVSGKDWVSGRELGTEERWFRGLLAPLDIIPGVGAIAKFGSAARLVRVGDQVGQVGLTTGIRSGFRQGVATVDNLVQTASRETMARLKSANAVVKDTANVVKNKLAKDIIEVGDLIDSGITKARNAFQLPQTCLVMADIGDIGRVSAPIENSHAVGNKMRDVLSRIDGVNLAGSPVKGTGEGKVLLGKGDLDALRKKWNVPETNTVAVGKTDVKGLEDLTFEGGSPEVRKEAGLPSLDDILPDREIRAPYNHLINPKLAQFTRHAEEGVLNEFDSAIKKAAIEPSDVTGTFRIHQSNPRGVCNKCSKGLLKPYPIEKSGIFYQASKKYPNLTIVVTSEIDESVKTNGMLSFVLKDGKIIE